jgi:tRNA threonylcarbamoyladenosine biosynthesis protein TsaB
MVTLALDTTTAAASVALAHDEHVLEVASIDPSQPIATRVPRDLMTLLDRHRTALATIDVFAVATGPGSFTGLRIGIATMQGLALAHARPLLGVSSFEALATLAAADGGAKRRDYVAVWIDAWRGEVYGALYARSELAVVALVDPAVASPDDLLRRAASPAVPGAPAADPATMLFVGDGAVKYRDRIPGRVVEPTPLIAGAIARIAHARAAQGEAPPPHAIRPLYVRRPDAELARERSSG